MGRILWSWLLLVTAAASGQSPAVLLVSVHSAAGEAVAGAKVTLSGLSAETDEAGSARLSNVPPGKHRLTISSPGFEELTTDIDADASPSWATIELF